MGVPTLPNIYAAQDWNWYHPGPEKSNFETVLNKNIVIYASSMSQSPVTLICVCIWSCPPPSQCSPQLFHWCPIGAFLSDASGWGQILPRSSFTSPIQKCIGAVGFCIRHMLLDLSNAHGPSDHVPRPAVAVWRAAATPRDLTRDIYVSVCHNHQGGPIPTNILPLTNLHCTTASTRIWNSGYFWFCGYATQSYGSMLNRIILITPTMRDDEF